jgi:ribosomal protein S18 acetylase RimI-like enzyme
MHATRTYLQLTDRGALVPKRLDREGVRVDRIERCAPSFWRSLYQEVGGPYHWVDRLPWTDAEINAYLSDPAVSLWVLTVDGEVGGYFELRETHARSVEIAYFGLRPGFYGQGLGAYLLTAATERAFDAGADRVWLHTSTLDHPAALPNYLKRGFRRYRSEEYEVGPI